MNCGAIEAALPIGAGVDATVYLDGQVFAGCRDGSLTVIDKKTGRSGVQQTVKTALGYRTMRGGGQHFYLPTAESEPATTGRPKAKPDTFGIIDVQASRQNWLRPGSAPRS